MSMRLVNFKMNAHTYGQWCNCFFCEFFNVLYEVFPLQKPITLVSAFADKFLMNTEGSGKLMLVNNKRLTFNRPMVQIPLSFNIQLSNAE